MNGTGPKIPQNLPARIVDKDGNPIIFTCPICGSINVGSPPHGENEPCPIAVRKANADAFMMNDLNAMMKKMGIIPDEED